MDTQTFIQQKFAEFYKEKSEIIKAPPSIRQREFGFLIFKGNVMVRHKGFTTVDALRSFIMETTPAHAYYSTAYYEMPEEKMENKGWLGADLYFDIDADHIETGCGKVHDSWTCRDCGFAGKGVTPEKCPSCGGNRFNNKTWPCEVCLESARQEMVKLVDMLNEDFGFLSDEIDVSFSGHRGYHVHVENEAIRGLDSAARKEIVDYITGVGLNPAMYGLGDTRLISSSSRSRRGLTDVGWRGRIARGAYQFLLDASKEDLRSLGLKEKTATELISEKEAILKSWENNGPWRPVRGMSKDELQAIVSHTIEGQSVKIDTVVTTDIHRLIRLPNSLHGKTGWLKVLFPISEMSSFDPLKTAVAFKKGEATIHVEEAPKFRLGEEWFGPFKDERVELPMAAAMFLLCKEAARLAD